jgi:hypothetical protein
MQTVADFDDYVLKCLPKGSEDIKTSREYIKTRENTAQAIIQENINRVLDLHEELETLFLRSRNEADFMKILNKGSAKLGKKKL